jgi:hypothetical protein
MLENNSTSPMSDDTANRMCNQAPLGDSASGARAHARPARMNNGHAANGHDSQSAPTDSATAASRAHHTDGAADAPPAPSGR